jgi:hypothetical protein
MISILVKNKTQISIICQKNIGAFIDIKIYIMFRPKKKEKKKRSQRIHEKKYKRRKKRKKGD